MVSLMFSSLIPNVGEIEGSLQSCNGRGTIHTNLTSGATRITPSVTIVGCT